MEYLLCYNQSQARSSHHRNHRQRTVSYRSRNKLFSFWFNIQSFLQENNYVSFLFAYRMCYNSEEYRFERFSNKLQNQCAGPTHVTVWRANFQTVVPPAHKLQCCKVSQWSFLISIASRLYIAASVNPFF